MNPTSEQDETMAELQDGFSKIYAAMKSFSDLHYRLEVKEADIADLQHSVGEKDKKIQELEESLSKANKEFINFMVNETAKIRKEQEDALKARDEAVRNAEMWKKSYEDLVKCV